VHQNILKICGRITKLQSVEKWHVFMTQQNATNLNISVSQGSAAI